MRELSSGADKTGPAGYYTDAIPSLPRKKKIRIIYYSFVNCCCCYARHGGQSYYTLASGAPSSVWYNVYNIISH